MNVFAHEKVFDLYNALKYEQKFKSLDMSEKLHLLERLGKTIIKYDEAGQLDKMDSLTPEFVLDNLNERGYKRTGRLLRFADDMEMKLREFQQSTKNTMEMKEEWKKKIFHI